jgi:signal transduction histidine kinase
MNPMDRHLQGAPVTGTRTPRTPSPEATFAQVDGVAQLVGKLTDLLDGSMRCIDAAKTNVEKTIAVTGHAAADEACKQLSFAAEQLNKMTDLVRGSLQSASKPIGSPLLSRARPVTLGEAILHAVDVVGPLAQRHQVAVSTQLCDIGTSTPAGGLYTVVLNGLMNAIEAIGRRGGQGWVCVELKEIQAPGGIAYGKDSRDWFELSITDDGIGPPGITDLSRVFDMGFTTKAGASGIGLAVARSVVQGMGGSIELINAAEKDHPTRRGAILRVRFPSPRSL